MNRNIYVIFLSLAFCLIACRQYPHIQPLLQEAETLMGSRPDSSLILLEAIPSPEKLSEEDYATWCLLMTRRGIKIMWTYVGFGDRGGGTVF